MKLLWQFIVAVIANFVFLVSGSILALYYVFASPYLTDSPLKTALEIGLPLLCFFLACYLAWRKQQLRIGELEAAIKKHSDKQPSYHFEVADDSGVIEDLIKEVDDKIKGARQGKANAPTPHPFLPSLMGEPSRESWQSYIDELNEYKVLLRSLIDSGEYHIVNFSLENMGHGDTNVNINLRFKGFTQIVDFYDDKIRLEEPYKPARYLGTVSGLNLSPANKLGNRREVQDDEPGRIIVEIDRIRHDDKIWLHYNPVFIKKSDTKKEIEYSIKSDGLAATKTKTIDLE